MHKGFVVVKARQRNHFTRIQRPLVLRSLWMALSAARFENCALFGCGVGSVVEVLTKWSNLFLCKTELLAPDGLSLSFGVFFFWCVGCFVGLIWLGGKERDVNGLRTLILQLFGWKVYSMDFYRQSFIAVGKVFCGIFGFNVQMWIYTHGEGERDTV